MIFNLGSKIPEPRSRVVMFTKVDRLRVKKRTFKNNVKGFVSFLGGKKGNGGL